jgi:hypothetical protein
MIVFISVDFHMFYIIKQHYEKIRPTEYVAVPLGCESGVLFLLLPQ